MTIRNRKSLSDALAARAYIAAIIAARGPFDPPTDDEIRRQMADGISLVAIRRHRQWLRIEYRRDGLAGFLERIRRARRGEPLA